MTQGKRDMSAVNAAFEKLLEYERRALSAPTDGDATDAGMGDWAGLAFRLGDTRLVCGLDRIQESIQLPQVTRVPGTKPFVLGLANVRGDLLTVIDLGCFLNGNRTPASMRTRMLAATLRGRPVGLLVDEVFGQRNFIAQNADTPELPDGSPLLSYVKKRHRSGSDSWQELDLDALFSAPEFLDGAAA
jgi:twitching motility protein PilI